MFYKMMMLAPDNGTEGGDLSDLEGIDFNDMEGIEIDTDEDEVEIPDDKPDDKPDEKPEKPKDEKTERMVPLKALQAERDKWRKKLEALQSQKPIEKPIEKTDSVKQKLIDSGFDENLAELLSSALTKSEGKTASIEKTVNKRFRDQEFRELAKDPMFSDIEDYREELEETAERFGISAEEAYMMKFGRTKLKSNRADLRRQIEQEILDDLKKKGDTKLDTSNNGNVESSKKVSLTKDELQLAKMAGMTQREYAVFKYGKSVDKFNLAKKG